MRLRLDMLTCRAPALRELLRWSTHFNVVHDDLKGSEFRRVDVQNERQQEVALAFTECDDSSKTSTHVRYCSTHCEALHELERYNAAPIPAGRVRRPDREKFVESASQN